MNKLNYHILYQICNDFRVAGEWILRCGGGVKYTNVDRYIWDYNSLPEWPRNKYEVEGIDAKNTYVTDGGLDHLGMHLFQP